ncbi:MAG: aldehyde dehydrogenase family protein, partial [Caulobacterales bacterium]|nr:aldehyde dehydrogenase family protein [Caulobacterales bacterium]
MSTRPRYQTVDPATGANGEAYDGHTRDEALAIVGRTRTAFDDWRRTPFAERARLMKAAAAVLRTRTNDFAALMTAEMGKTLTDGLAEIEKCAGGCEFYAEHTESFLAPEPATIEGARAYATFNPLGVVLAVMPWNFPFWQVFRFAAPALMAGNGAVLKHASNVPGCVLAIEGVFREAGFPADLFRALLIPSGEVRSL